MNERYGVFNSINSYFAINRPYFELGGIKKEAPSWCFVNQTGTEKYLTSKY